MSVRMLFALAGLLAGFSAFAMPPIAGHYVCTEPSSGVSSPIQLEVKGEELSILGSEWSEDFSNSPLVCANKTDEGVEEGINFKSISECSKSEVRWIVTMNDPNSTDMVSVEISVKVVAVGQVQINFKGQEKSSLYNSGFDLNLMCTRSVEQKPN